MEINILHLYYDLMNLYGESGNVKALMNAFSSQDINTNIDYLSIEDEIDFNKYDLIYIGSSTEENQMVALNDIMKYKDKLYKYINDNKFILCTGNSLELFGSKINDIDALKIFDYKSKYVDKRIVGDYINDTIFNKIIAFQNRGSKLEDNDIPFIEKEIGVNYNNFYGTYLIGPLLVRNPNITEYFVKEIIKLKYKDFDFKDFDFSLEEEARNNYLKNYYE